MVACQRRLRPRSDRLIVRCSAEFEDTPGHSRPFEHIEGLLGWPAGERDPFVHMLAHPRIVPFLNMVNFALPFLQDHGYASCAISNIGERLAMLSTLCCACRRCSRCCRRLAPDMWARVSNVSRPHIFCQTASEVHRRMPSDGRVVHVVQGPWCKPPHVSTGCYGLYCRMAVHWQVSDLSNCHPLSRRS